MEQSAEILLDNKYNLLSKLGTGGTAEVLLGESKDSHEKVAIKILKDNNLIQIFEQEIQMLKRIQNSNIINILDGGSGTIIKDGVDSDIRCYLVLELAENGELFDFVFYPRSGFGEHYGRFLFNKILDGIEACHTAGVVHRDIKMENIMVDGKWNVKIADFGFATLIEGKKGNGILTTPLGTISYAAPEILSKKPYIGIPADIFSLGALLFTLVTGRMGFSKAAKGDPFYKNICKKDHENYWKLISKNNKMSFSDEFKDLFTKIIAYEPKERPSIQDIKSHSWMNLPMPTFEEMKIEFENRAKLVRKSPEVQIEQTEGKKNPVVYRSIENEYFDKIIKCSKVNEKNPNNCKINLKGIVPYIFMNQLACYIDTKTKENKTLTPIQENGELIITYEPEQFEDCEVEIEPLEITLKLESFDESSNLYYLYFQKNSGDKMKFYEVYDDLLSFIKKI